MRIDLNCTPLVTTGTLTPGRRANLVTHVLALIVAGLAAFVHAAVPGWFSDTAGKVVTRTYNYIQKRKAESPTPENWSDYDI